MSRIGKLPIAIPAGVTVSVDGNNLVTVKGPKATLTQQINKIIKVEINDGHVIVTRPNDLAQSKAMHGLYRTLINNMVKGVHEGYKKTLIIKGVGYKVAKQGNKIVMNIGYSHPVEVAEVPGLTLNCPTVTEITVEGADKEQVGQMAAKIRAIKPVEPYHSYGIRYVDEVVITKVGKTAAKKK